MTETQLNTDSLNQLQIDRGLTDDELAAVMEITPRTLHNWRSGYVKPTWNRIVRAARALDVEPATLIIRDEVPA